MYQGRYTRRGVWNEKSPHNIDKIWTQPKDQLMQVTIEAEDRKTKKIVPMVSLGAWDFVTMTVEAYARLDFGKKKQDSAFSGLSLVSSKKKVTVWVDGSVTQRDLRPNELNING